MNLKLNFILIDAKPKEGSKNSTDSLLLKFKRQREEQLIDPDDNDNVIDLIATFSHLWNKTVKIKVSRKDPVEGLLNEEIEFVGVVKDTTSKDLKDGETQYFGVSCGYDVNKFSQISNYWQIKVMVDISEVNPDLRQGEAD